jgi:HEAT repeat protein
MVLPFSRNVALHLALCLIGYGVVNAQIEPYPPSDARDVPSLISRLKHPEEIERASAAFLLGRLSSDATPAIPALIPMLGDSSEVVRRASAEALGMIQPSTPEVVTALVSALGDNSERVRITVVTALGRLTPMSIQVGLPALANSLGDPSEAVRRVAMNALRAMGPPAVSTIVSCLGDSRRDVRDAAETSLHQMGSIAAPELLNKLGTDAQSDVRAVIVEILGWSRPLTAKIVTALTNALADQSEIVRVSAANALKASDESAIPVLIGALNNESPSVRKCAVEALGYLSVKEPGVLPSIVRALSDPSETVRLAAVTTLGPAISLKDVRNTILLALRSALKDSSEQVRLAALKSVEFWPDDKSEAAVIVASSDGASSVRKEALIALRIRSRTNTEDVGLRVQVFGSALTDVDEDVRLEATEGLFILGANAKGASQQLLGALNDTSNKVRSGALEALSRVDPTSQEAATAIARLLNDNDASVRKSAAYALRLMGGVGAVELAAALKNSDASVRENAAEAIEAMDFTLSRLPPTQKRQVAAALLSAITDDNQRVRGNVGLALALMKPDPPEIMPLLGALLRDYRSDVRISAIYIAQKLGPAGKEAVPAILAALKDPNSDVQRAAAEALVQIAPGSSEIGTALINALKESSESNRFYIALALARTDPRTTQVAPELIKALRSGSEPERKSAVEALGAMGRPVVPSLAITLQDENLFARRGAVEALLAIGADAYEAQQDLVGALRDQDASVREDAARTLGKLGPAAKDAVPPLVRLAEELQIRLQVVAAESEQKGTDPKLTPWSEEFEAVAAALGDLGPIAKNGAPVLVRVLAHPDEKVRKTAAQALIEIGPGAVSPIVDGISNWPRDSRSRFAVAQSAAIGILATIAEQLEDVQDISLNAALKAAPIPENNGEQDGDEVRRFRRALTALEIMERDGTSSAVAAKAADTSIDELASLDIQRSTIQIGKTVMPAGALLTRGDDKRVRLRPDLPNALGGIQGFATAVIKTTSGTQKKITLILEQGKQRIFKPYNKSFALMIAISEYPVNSGYRRLPDAVKQAKKLADVLYAQGFIMLPPLYNSDATADNIRKALREAPVGENDRLFVYFGGHGDDLKMLDGQALGFIVTYNATSTTLRKSAIPVSELRGPLAQVISAKQVLFALDSCQSGLVLERGNDDDERHLRALRGIEAMSREYGRMFLTAGTGGQAALDINGGIFTQALIDGIQGKADASQDGVVTFPELYNYTSESVNQTAQANGRKQDVGWDVVLGHRGWVFVTDRSLFP